MCGQIQAPTAGHAVASDQALAGRRVLLALTRREVSESDLCPRPENIVLRDKRIDNVLGRMRQSVISGAHIGELGFAVAQGTGRRQGHSVQQPQHDRHRHIGRIRMPQPVSQAVQPAPIVKRSDSVVLIEVGDIADLRDREPSPARTRRGSADLQGAKTPGKIAQLRICQMLVAEDQNRIGIHRGPDVGDYAIVRLFRQVKAGDFRRESGVQFPRLDGHCGHASGIILRRLRQTRKFHSRRDANWRPRFGDRGPISRLRLAIFPLNLRVKFNHLFGSRIFGLGRGGHKSIFDDQMRPHAMAGDVMLGRCCAIFLAMSPDQRANTAAVRVFGTLGGRLPKPPIKPWPGWNKSVYRASTRADVQACSQTLGARIPAS